MIFSELYSVYYNTVAKIIEAAFNPEATEKDLQRCVVEEAFSESVLTILPALKSGKWPLLHEDLSPALLHRFAEHGYNLPQIVFWNVASRNSNQPVTKNEQGVALVSGCTPRLFSMVASGDISPYSVMMEIIKSERYSKISA